MTEDDLTLWALFHPELAGATDDEPGLRERYVAWEHSRMVQSLQNNGTFPQAWTLSYKRP